MVKNEFADRLKSLLTEKGVDPLTLARAINVTGSTVYYYIEGTYRPTRDRMAAIASFLDVPIETLEPKVRTDCSLHGYDTRGRHFCRGLRKCYCETEGECRFYKAGPVDPPDPLYTGPATPRSRPGRIPKDVMDRALELRARGYMWSEVAKKVGYDSQALRNRAAQMRRTAERRASRAAEKEISRHLPMSAEE